MASLCALMPVFEIVIGVVIAAAVVFQAWLTLRVFRSQIYERKQKIWQAQLIWLLPIIGAGLVFTILEEDRKAERDATQLKS
jgi:cytochrome bd-type quinol oxidase subunit 2